MKSSLYYVSGVSLVINQSLLDAVERIAREAADVIMHVYTRDFSVEKKVDQSPLTEADKAAHMVIMQGLQQLPTQLPILSEEDVESFSGPETDIKGRYWLVDPLDGTKEFIKRNGEFTVNIALIQEGQPVLGVVLAPALELGYVAAEGLGAFKIVATGQRHAIRVAGKPSVTHAWRVVGSRSHPSPDLAVWLDKLGKHEMRPMGSSLKLCLVAEGEADIYPRLGPTCLWDTAAAHAVLRQAGGRLETLDGIELNYLDPFQILNPYFLVFGY